jgi:RimJ/RimL family protein N-acetyltransferase
MFPILCDPLIYQFIPAKPPRSARLLAERYRQLQRGCSADGSQQWLNWVIRLSDRGLCIGYIQATIYPQRSADFAFVLGSGFWGRGFAYEASTCVLQSLFTDHAATSIFATSDKQNARSIGLLTRLGFGGIANHLYPHGEVLPTDRAFLLTRKTAPSGKSRYQ